MWNDPIILLLALIIVISGFDLCFQRISSEIQLECVAPISTMKKSTFGISQVTRNVNSALVKTAMSMLKTQNIELLITFRFSIFCA